ncbi:MAG TPA: HEAT repeat domain-containing protein [Blastocatellia bacterium]|nr:HEAT repeat domain-containing protein [Blastocatellia bacterium]
MPANVKRAFVLTVTFALLAVTAMAEDQSLETLLAYLKSPIPKTRQDAARKLGERRLRDKLVVEALTVAVSKDEDPDVRAEAVLALGLIKDFAALPDMLGALKDPYATVREQAAKALVMLYTEQNIAFITNRREGWNRLNPFLDTDDREVIEPYIIVEPSIIQALGEAASGDSDRSARIAAIRALGVLRGSAAIPDLAAALNADEGVRIDVLRTFIKIGDPEAGQHLTAFFRDSNDKVRTQAMVAAGLLEYRPAVEPLLSVYGLGPEKKGRIAKMTRSVKGLFSYLPPRDEAALWALSLIGDERAEQVFVENMTDKNGNRRQYAFEGLARIADPRYADQISRLILTEKDDDVKLAQRWALYRMGERGHLQEIVRHLDSGKSEKAREYLLKAPNPADLYPYVRANNKTVRREVIDILGNIGDREAIRELEPVAQTAGAGTADVAVVAIKRIEWRLAGRPNVSDEVLRREIRPRRAANP